MKVLLLGASGRIGTRTAEELLQRDHEVTGVSRSGTVDGVDDTNLTEVAGDATDSDTVAELASGHDAVISALGPSGEQEPSILAKMINAVVEGMRETDVDRLIWTGGAGGLYIDDETLLIDSEAFPEEARPVAEAAIEAYAEIEDVEDIRWSYMGPAAFIEPGERTGSYRTADRQLIADEDGNSYISMEDFAIALVDELEEPNAIHTYLGVGH